MNLPDVQTIAAVASALVALSALWYTRTSAKAAQNSAGASQDSAHASARSADAEEAMAKLARAQAAARICEVELELTPGPYDKPGRRQGRITNTGTERAFNVTIDTEGSDLTVDGWGDEGPVHLGKRGDELLFAYREPTEEPAFLVLTFQRAPELGGGTERARLRYNLPSPKKNL